MKPIEETLTTKVNAPYKLTEVEKRAQIEQMWDEYKLTADGSFEYSDDYYNEQNYD